MTNAVTNLLQFEHYAGQKARFQAIELFHQAYQLQMKGDYRQAIRLYTDSLAKAPTAEAHTFLGWTYSFLGELDAAIVECQAAIELDPDFGNPYNDIGAYFIAQGRYEEAFPFLEKALSAKRYRAYHFAHFNLGRVYEHRGDFLNAYRAYKQAITTEPRYLIAYHAMERIKHETAKKVSQLPETTLPQPTRSR